jgi:hypothetical protein
MTTTNPLLSFDPNRQEIDHLTQYIVILSRTALPGRRGRPVVFHNKKNPSQFFWFRGNKRVVTAVYISWRMCIWRTVLDIGESTRTVSSPKKARMNADRDAPGPKRHDDSIPSSPSSSSSRYVRRVPMAGTQYNMIWSGMMNVVCWLLRVWFCHSVGNQYAGQIQCHIITPDPIVVFP